MKETDIILGISDFPKGRKGSRREPRIPSRARIGIQSR
jgi:hypothetical protein